MPRYQNLKNTMNPYKNRQIGLSSSERTKNKKDTYVYAAAKQKFQTNRRCKNKNIRYYKNGKVRSNVSYEYKNDLARGNVLCNDCDRERNTCGDIFVDYKPRIAMHNNNFSEFNGGDAIIPDISYNAASGDFFYIGITQSQGLSLIQSDVSGTWDSSANDFKGDIALCGPSNNIICPYGYTNDVINIPRNLDGKGITIDPSNVLFGGSCRTRNYMYKSSLKATIIMRGSIDLSMNMTSSPPFSPFVHADTCNDPSYNIFINNFVSVVVDTGINNTPIDFLGVTGVFYGIIRRICCLNKIDGIPWMDIHIEVIGIGKPDMLNELLIFKPKYRGPNWKTLAPVYSQAYGPFNWAPLKLPWALFIYNETTISTNPLNVAKSVTTSGYFSDINFILGDCKNNLTQTTTTKGTYMSCLEDGTKKINFTRYNPFNLKP